MGTGIADCALKTVRADGPAGLFRGLGANVARLCPAVIIQLPLMEQMRILAGLDYFGLPDE